MRGSGYPEEFLHLWPCLFLTSGVSWLRGAAFCVVWCQLSCCAGGEGDACRCSVFAQLIDGGDADAVLLRGDAVFFQEGGNAAGGEADGGLVGAEQLFEQPVGHAQPDVAGGGGHDGPQRQAGGGG